MSTPEDRVEIHTQVYKSKKGYKIQHELCHFEYGVGAHINAENDNEGCFLRPSDDKNNLIFSLQTGLRQAYTISNRAPGVVELIKIFPILEVEGLQQLPTTKEIKRLQRNLEATMVELVPWTIVKEFCCQTIQ